MERGCNLCLFSSSLPDHTPSVKRQQTAQIREALTHCGLEGIVSTHYIWNKQSQWAWSVLLGSAVQIKSVFFTYSPQILGQCSRTVIWNWETASIYKKNYSFYTAHLMWMIIRAKLEVSPLHSLFHFKSNNVLDRDSRQNMSLLIPSGCTLCTRQIMRGEIISIFAFVFFQSIQCTGQSGEREKASD